MDKEEALKLIEIYGKAWETKDPDLIVTIFTEDATYYDPREPENIGRDAIREYWVTKVIGEQDNIKFTLKHLVVSEDIVMAEWHASFDDIKRDLHIELDEAAVFGVIDGKFSFLREYYRSVKTPLEK
ncbi:MAG: nuclear transport factor 2 family protein [Candidatus Paceibacterota bacterium]